MRGHPFLVFLFGALALLPGCDRRPPAQQPSDEHHLANPSAPVDIPVTLDADGRTQLVAMTGDDNMRYNGTRFTVTAGSPVHLQLQNIGKNPPALMAHNVVVLKSGSDAEGFALAAGQAKDHGYLPPPLMGDALAFTAFAGPSESVEVTFTPPGPGQYVFLCSFPGHYSAGMHGVMIVQPAK